MLFFRRGNEENRVPFRVYPATFRAERHLPRCARRRAWRSSATRRTFFAGLLFVAFGIAAIAIGSGYPLGTAARMGPGYFPRILGILLITFGAAIAARGLKLRGSRSCSVRRSRW